MVTPAIYPRHVFVNSRFIRPFIDLTIYGWPWKISIAYFNIVCSIIFQQQSFILVQCTLINVLNINWFLNQLKILKLLWNCNRFLIERKTYLLQFVSCKICWIAWRGSIWNAHVVKKTAKCNCEVSYQNRPQKCYWKPRTRLLLKVNDHSGFKPRGDQFWVNWDFLNENSVSFLSLDSGNITSLHCKIAS